MRRLWLVFAEFVTVTLAVIFVVTLIRPDWNPWRKNIVEIRQDGTPGSVIGVSGSAGRPSYAEAAARAKVSVVNVSTSRASPLPKR
ncbi:MAG: 2-alkenal reductase, partial [Rhodocyclaceae bacterium]|nr:2-alkenal reductase [Rhodocyclaceae bacterium]